MTTYEKKEVLLSVNNVCLSFDNKKEVKNVLGGINLQIKNITRPGVHQGQVASLIGESGIGKTQLFMILAGLNKPTSGEVLIGAEQRPVKAGDMGIVTQDYYLFPWRKIKDTLRISAQKNNKFKSAQEINDVIAGYVDDFRLAEHMNKYPAQLSGGQRQRVCIVQQLLNGCDFLLMDEPFSGLDFKMIDKTIDLLIKVSQSDELKTIIIISHDHRNCVAISDTVFLLSNKGREQQGSVIVKEIDLIERGLAWMPEIKDTQLFSDAIKEIKSLL
jgi:ABC-type nitrate/sulfonate/bicarbonate transport system ATPase subunit